MGKNKNSSSNLLWTKGQSAGFSIKRCSLINWKMLRMWILFLAVLRLSWAFLELKLLVSRFISTDVGFVFEKDGGFTPFSLLKSACQTSVLSINGCKDSPRPGTFAPVGELGIRRDLPPGGTILEKVRRQI